MKLVIFNGSPKKSDSNNTNTLIRNFSEGFLKTAGNEVAVYKLNNFDSLDEAVDLFSKAEYILFAFPMYNFSIPVGTLDFIYKLQPFANACSDKKIGFMVQYGYLEAGHARPLEKYLEYLVQLFSAKYLGTIIRGGGDSLTIRPELEHNIKLCMGIKQIGQLFGEKGWLEKDVLKSYSKPENQLEISFSNKIKMRMFIHRMNKNYWMKRLLKNGVSREQSFVRPYEH